jgi:hypothetical protein
MRRCLPFMLPALLAALVACGTSGGGTDTVPDESPDAVEPADLPGDDAATDPTPDPEPEVADDAKAEAGEDPGAEDVTPELPPRVCRDGTQWKAGTVAFKDVTAESSLGALGVDGVRLNSVDFDGDGKPDLVVRYYAYERDVFAGDKPVRHTYLLRNLGGFQFEDVTEKSGFLATRDGGTGRVVQTVVWGDVDNDGDLDAFTGISMNPDPAQPDLGDRNEIVLNNGDGTFSLAPASDPRHPDDRMATAGASFTDYDRDGKLDLFVPFAMGQYEPQVDELYRGDGTGAFANVTAAAGMVLKTWIKLADIQAGTVNRYSWGSTACDVNGDGWPDLLVATYGRYFSLLWYGSASGVFTDGSFRSGYASDDRKDWTTNLNAQCYCKLHPDAEDCPGVPAPPPYFGCSASIESKLRWDHQYDRQDWRLAGNQGTSVCGDVDNDGDMDLLNLDIVHWDVGPSSDPTELLINDGQGHFTRPGNVATGLDRKHSEVDWNEGDMTGAFVDFDNDGRLDVLIASSDYPGTKAWLYHQKADGTFEYVPPAVGITHPRAHGVAVADLDGDGDLDVVLGHGTARCTSGEKGCYPTSEVHVFRNELGQDGNWLRVTLVGGEGSNRSAIGARVRVTAGGATQTQEVGGGYGQAGIQHDLTLHFGLGAACDVDKVEVRWPDAAGTTETFEAVRGNYRVRITQGAAIEYL